MIIIIILCVSLLSIGVVGVIWLYSAHVHFKNKIASYEEDFIEQKRQTLKQEVHRAINYIEYMRAQVKDRLTIDVRNRTTEAYEIANSIYLNQKDNLPVSEIKKLVKDALRPIRFNNGRGYYFATRLDGVEELFADKPDIEGLNLIDLRDTQGQYVIKDMIELAKAKGEGFYNYYWTKPGQEGQGFPKIAFIKYFEPFDWFIGTGEYLDDVEKDIQAEVIERIIDIKFGRDGYIFIGTFEGLSLTKPAKGRNMIDVTDPNGVKIVQELIKVSRSGGGFVRYVIPEFEGIINAPKLSYAISIDDWGWYIGAGIYIGEIDAIINQAKEDEQKRIRVTLWNIFLALIGVFLGIIILAKFITGRMKKNFAQFSCFFADASTKHTKIDTSIINISEFAELAESANQMIDFRNQTEQELQESKMWTEAIVSSIQSGIMVIDASTQTIIDINPEATRMIGCAREEIIGKVCHDYVCSNKIGCCPIIDGGKELINEERELVTSQGSIVPIIKTASKVTLQGKVFIFESFVDLTEKKKLEEQLRQSEKMQAMGTLAGGIAHDFNNLMMGIQGRVSILQQETDLSDSQHEHLASIAEYIKNASSLTTQLLGLARGGKYDIKPTDINALFKKQVMLLGRTRKDIQITTEYETNIWTVEVDQNQMIQVFWNLFINASQAMPHGGTVFIKTENLTLDDEINGYYTTGRYVKLSLQDTGIGMDSETLKRAFDPFFTTKDKERGTGLGLASVYGIIKNHDGFVDIQSEQKQGTIVTVLLPASNKQPIIIKEKKNGIIKGSGTILIVDDEEMIREVGGEMLKVLGYDVLLASNGREALEIYLQHQAEIKVVILDMVMPGMGGGETYKKLKEIDSDVTVILSSGYSLDSDTEQLLAEGCRSFIQKPFSIEILSQELKSVLPLTR